MFAKRSAHIVATAFGMGVLALGVLTACSDDSEGGSPVAVSSGESPIATTSDCGGAAPRGPLAIPTESVDYTTGQAAYSVTLSDGTTQCIEIDESSDAGEFDSTDKEVEVRFGDAHAGILLTVDGESTGNLPTDLPHDVEDVFMGLQVDGGYFADSMHTGCDLTLTGFDGQAISGTFTCSGVALFDDGPFSVDGNQTVTPQPLDTSIEKAEGWFVVRV